MAEPQAPAPASPASAPAPPDSLMAPDLVRDPDDDSAAAAGAAAIPIAPSDPRARLQWLNERVAAAIAAQPKLAPARIAVSVTDLVSGAQLVARDAERAMNLASVTKLFTASAAMATLGGGFRWRTALYGNEPDKRGVVAGPLYVKARGDPVLSVADLQALAADLAGRGVRTVDRLVIDGSYFDGLTEPPRFDDQKSETAAFRAPVASFSVARSAVSIVVVADPGGRARVTLEPNPGDYIKLVNRGVTSVARGATRIKVDVKPTPEHLEIEVSGQIRWGEGRWETRKRVSDPARYAGGVLQRALAERGVKLKSRVLGTGTVPANAKLLAAHDSIALSEVIRAMNKLSDNFLAECILKTLGAETRAVPGPATWDDGRAAIRGYLAKLGMPSTGYRMENGSGLFDATEVSAKQVTTLLRAAHKDYRIGPDLVASLPAGGLDGTLAKRWHGRPALGRVRAKTGTLDKVVTLAGYIALDSEHPLGFAILVNDIPAGQRAGARAVADEIIDALAAYLGAR